MTKHLIEPAVPMYSAIRLDSVSGQRYVDAFSVSPDEKETMRRARAMAIEYPTLQIASPIVWGPRGEVLALVAVHFIKWSE